MKRPDAGSFFSSLATRCGPFYDNRVCAMTWRMPRVVIYTARVACWDGNSMAEFLRQRRFTAVISVIGVLFGDFLRAGMALSPC